MGNGELSKRAHERLDVWQEAMRLVEMIYTLTAGFPADERFGLTTPNPASGSQCAVEYCRRCGPTLDGQVPTFSLHCTRIAF